MNTEKDWMRTKWRPMMAITYMAICLCDFILFPILWTLAQLLGAQPSIEAFRQWQAMTLQSGGFIHITFMAILGISAWTRGQEKIEAIKTGKTEDA